MTSPDDLLAQDLRSIAPRPSPELRARLDAQVAAGFPRPPRRRFALPRTRLLVPALGTLGAALVAVAIVVGGGDDGQDLSSSARMPEGATEQAPSSAADSAASAGGSAAAPAPAAPPDAMRQAAPGRRVERSARLELGAPAGRFSSVTDGVVRTTQRHDGFVASSQIGRDAAQGTATFVLRVPTAQLDAALADLSRLASVRGIEQATQDLTGSYDATSARLDDARTTRRSIVSALATATGAEADRLRARLRDATARVERLERSQRELRTRTTYATVDLTVTSSGSGAVAPPKDGPWTPGDAWRDARRGLEVAAGVLIVVGCFAVPIGLLAWLAAWLRRRRRAALLG